MIELVPMAYRVVRDVESPAGQKMEDEEERDAVFFRLDALGYRVGQGLVERYVYLLNMRGEIYVKMGNMEKSKWEVRYWWTHRFSKDRPRFVDTLDVIKFLCKDLWMLVFRKQIDNLKTNHRVSSLDPWPIYRC